MRLRAQLLALALATLLLPWAGCQYVQELEGALRDGQEQALTATAGALAAALDDSGGRLRDVREGETLYLHRLAREPLIDGFDTDWDLPQAARQRLADGASWLRAARSARYLYLFVSVADDNVLHHRGTGSGPADRVVLQLGHDDGPARRRLVFAPEAPGAFSPRPADGRWEPSGDAEDRVLAHWQPRRDGYQVEMRLPLDLVGERVGVGFIDVDSRAADAPQRAVLSWTLGQAPGPLVEADRALAATLRSYLPSGLRATVLDPEGWILARAGGVAHVAMPDFETDAGGFWLALRNRLYTWWLSAPQTARAADMAGSGRLHGEAIAEAMQGSTGVVRYRDRDGTVLNVAVPLGNGVLLLEQGSAEIVTLTNRTLTRVLTLGLGVIGVLALLLLGYASWLSWRVRRLSRAAAGALGPRGEVRVSMPGIRRADEIGDLARAFSSLLDRVAGYTRYLQGLGSRLSHEFRTPLAVVSSSLERLSGESTEPSEREACLQRAREGTARLQAILGRLSEATQAEQMVGSSTRECYDPAPVVESCARAYRELHGNHRIEWRIDTAGRRVSGQPDLLAQALDKLVDNAVDFTPAGGRIAIGLLAEDDDLTLWVDNEGSSLPDGMSGQLFDSLVSLREARSSGVHLGLGLYLVRLIAAFHGGRADALNLPDDRGVRVRLSLPATD